MQIYEKYSVLPNKIRYFCSVLQNKIDIIQPPSYRNITHKILPNKKKIVPLQHQNNKTNDNVKNTK